MAKSKSAINISQGDRVNQCREEYFHAAMIKHDQGQVLFCTTCNMVVDYAHK